MGGPTQLLRFMDGVACCYVFFICLLPPERAAAFFHFLSWFWVMEFCVYIPGPTDYFGNSKGSREAAYWPARLHGEIDFECSEMKD
jgi:hypothetical protein